MSRYIVSKRRCNLLITNGFAWNGKIYFRSEKYATSENINHEAIHLIQQKELIEFCFNSKVLGLSLFLLIYLIDTIISLFNARNTGFEKEAYENETNLNYILSRDDYGWLKYIFKKRKDMDNIKILKRIILNTFVLTIVLFGAITLKYREYDVINLHNISLSCIFGLFIALGYETILRFTK